MDTTKETLEKHNKEISYIRACYKSQRIVKRHCIEAESAVAQIPHLYRLEVAVSYY